MKILISACLLGQRVRYDGGHCLQEDPWLQELAAKKLLAPICPEMEAGLEVPREPIELKNGEVVNARGERLTQLFEPVFEKLEALLSEKDIKLAILKDKSPSCGARRIYDGSFSGKLKEGQGIVAAWLSLRIPVFTENELNEAKAAYSKFLP